MDINGLLGIKQGYSLDDKPEFKRVRDFIIKNGYSARNFDKNLQTLIIRKAVYSNKKNIPKYDPYFNRITGETEGSDFIHELFHMASNINDGVVELGVMYRDGTGESLNEGMTDYFTVMVSNNQNLSYPFEVLFFEFINQIYSHKRKEISSTYFEGDPDKFYNIFGEEKEIILQAIKELDKYTRDRKHNAIISTDIITKRLLVDQSISTPIDKETPDFVPFEKIAEELTNAFSIVVEKFVRINDSYAAELIMDFEDLAYSEFDEKDAFDICELLNSKISKVKTL